MLTVYSAGLGFPPAQVCADNSNTASVIFFKEFLVSVRD
jgi:hypothetical protein